MLPIQFQLLLLNSDDFERVVTAPRSRVGLVWRRADVTKVILVRPSHSRPAAAFLRRN